MVVVSMWGGEDLSACARADWASWHEGCIAEEAPLGIKINQRIMLSRHCIARERHAMSSRWHAGTSCPLPGIAKSAFAANQIAGPGQPVWHVAGTLNLYLGRAVAFTHDPRVAQMRGSLDPAWNGMS